jgi:hypothetical protein
MEANVGNGITMEEVAAKAGEMEAKEGKGGEKAPKDADRLRKSSIGSPVRAVWAIATLMWEKNPHVTRKEVVSAAVGYGVALYTARTQYQAWYANVRKPAELAAKAA